MVYTGMVSITSQAITYCVQPVYNIKYSQQK